MTRFAIDSPTAIRLLTEHVTIAPQHALVAPALLRSQALSQLYRAVRSGELTEKEGRTLLTGIATMQIRLLGDRVSRATAWKIAGALDWDDTTRAEYLAVAQLQADYLITADDELAAAARGIVEIAPFSALTSA